jgi:mannose/fructose-specific phosphotransferase system component IIA
MESKGITSSIPPNTNFDVLTSSVSNRRVYGFAVLSSDNAIQTIKIYLNDGTNVCQIYTVSIPASSGTNGTAVVVDVFGSTMGEAVFQKMRDTNGLAYFNLLAGWSIQMQYNTTFSTSTETITTHIFGEIY